jgi:hypothetical protein
MSLFHSFLFLILSIIEHQSQEGYGYEVNYTLFNYFLFAKRKYKINLGVDLETEKLIKFSDTR